MMTQELLLKIILGNISYGEYCDIYKSLYESNISFTDESLYFIELVLYKQYSKVFVENKMQRNLLGVKTYKMMNIDKIIHKTFNLGKNPNIERIVEAIDYLNEEPLIEEYEEGY